MAVVAAAAGAVAAMAAMARMAAMLGERDHMALLEDVEQGRAVGIAIAARV
ncbi:hypothetical protein INQ16_26450 [Escherichia coli]|nr:hypothetical protein [Escherichia coli]